MKRFTSLVLFLMFVFTQTWSQNYSSIWLEKFHFNRGEDIVVHYSNGFGFPKDNMNIAPLGRTMIGIPGHYSTTWCYFDNPGAKEGTATIPGRNMGSDNAPDGYYWIVYLIDDGYEQGSEYIPCYYGNEIPVNETPALSLEECSADFTTVTFTDSELWRYLIKEISADGVALTTDDYSLEAGALYILKDLTAVNTLKITAWDHEDAVLQIKGTSIKNEKLDQVISFKDNTLQIVSTNNEIQKVSIISLAGTVLESHQIHLGNNLFNLNHLNAGVYFAKVTGNGIGKVVKIVISE